MTDPVRPLPAALCSKEATAPFEQSGDHNFGNEVDLFRLLLGLGRVSPPGKVIQFASNGKLQGEGRITGIFGRQTEHMPEAEIVKVAPGAKTERERTAGQRRRVIQYLVEVGRKP